MDPNPYAPPTSDAGPTPTGLVFSEEGMRVANSLALWMRILGFVYAVAAVLVAIWAFGFLFFFPVVSMVAVLIVGLVWMGGAWLRGAGTAFVHGVAGDDEMAIGSGFGKLRSYLILIGSLALLQLLATLVTAVGMVL